MNSFRYQPEKIAVGTLYHYTKSNIDGSHCHDIALYVAATDQIESCKWHAGSDQALLVAAQIDWATFSVAAFSSWHIHDSGGRTFRGKTQLTRVVQPDGAHQLQLVDSNGSTAYKQTLTIGPYPWHSYDFDLASLNFTFRHLVDPLQSFTIGIVDPDWPAFARNEMSIIAKGPVEIRYLASEMRAGIACRRYAINGPGLEERGGFIWVCQAGEHIVNYEINLPDEPGFDSGKLQLEAMQTITKAGWLAFLQAQLHGAMHP